MVDGIGGLVKGSLHCKILLRRVIQTTKQVAEVAQPCHTNVVIKYVSADDTTHDKATLEEQWKNIKMLPGTQKMHSIIPTKNGKVKAAEILATTFKEYTLSVNAKASQSSQNVNVSSSLQGYLTQLSSHVAVQYQVGQWVIVKYESQLFPGEITMVIPDKVKVNTMIHHGANLQK